MSKHILKLNFCLIIRAFTFGLDTPNMGDVRTFLNMPTIHGLSWISISRRFSRLFWILVVIIGFILQLLSWFVWLCHSLSGKTSRKWLTVAIFRKWQDRSVALWIEIAVILNWRYGMDWFGMVWGWGVRWLVSSYMKRFHSWTIMDYHELS